MIEKMIPTVLITLHHLLVFVTFESEVVGRSLDGLFDTGPRNVAGERNGKRETGTTPLGSVVMRPESQEEPGEVLHSVENFVDPTRVDVNIPVILDVGSPVSLDDIVSDVVEQASPSVSEPNETNAESLLRRSKRNIKQTQRLIEEI
jgi:hypothetical protein